MVAVDTNVLIRVLARDDVRQVAIAEAFVAQGAWISHLVLVETMWVLRSEYDHGHDAIARAIEMLLRHQHYTIQDRDVVIAALMLYRARPSLGFTDCLVLEIARQAGHLPLATFDRNLGRLDGAHQL